MLRENGRWSVEIRLHFCVLGTKVGGYMEESLNGGFCLIGDGGEWRFDCIFAAYLRKIPYEIHTFMLSNDTGWVRAVTIC